MALNRDEICDRINTIIQPILKSLQLELVEIEYKRSGREAVLRIFIDKDGGVTLDNCADVSHELSLILDIEDFIPCEYNLEVSSPGLDRPLKTAADYERFQGRLIKVKTYELLPDDAGNKRKTFLGKLTALRDGVVVMTLNEGQTASIPLERVAKANLEFQI